MVHLHFATYFKIARILPLGPLKDQKYLRGFL